MGITFFFFFAKLWCDFYGSGSDRIGQSEKFDEYHGSFRSAKFSSETSTQYEGEAVIQFVKTPQNAPSGERSLDGWVAAFGLS